MEGKNTTLLIDEPMLLGRRRLLMNKLVKHPDTYFSMVNFTSPEQNHIYNISNTLVYPNKKVHSDGYIISEYNYPSGNITFDSVMRGKNFAYGLRLGIYTNTESDGINKVWVTKNGYDWSEIVTEHLIDNLTVCDDGFMYVSISDAVFEGDFVNRVIIDSNCNKVSEECLEYKMEHYNYDNIRNSSRYCGLHNMVFYCDYYNNIVTFVSKDLSVNSYELDFDVTQHCTFDDCVLLFGKRQVSYPNYEYHVKLFKCNNGEITYETINSESLKLIIKMGTVFYWYKRGDTYYFYYKYDDTYIYKTKDFHTYELCERISYGYRIELPLLKEHDGMKTVRINPYPTDIGMCWWKENDYATFRFGSRFSLNMRDVVPDLTPYFKDGKIAEPKGMCFYASNVGNSYHDQSQEIIVYINTPYLSKSSTGFAYFTSDFGVGKSYPEQ